MHVYDVRSSVRMTERMVEMAEPIAIAMEGSMCLVKNAPGQADFARLSRAMAERAVVPIHSRRSSGRSRNSVSRMPQS